MWHQASVVAYHIDASIGLNGCIDQAFHLLSVGDIRLEGQGFASTAVQYVSQCLETLDTTRS